MEFFTPDQWFELIQSTIVHGTWPTMTAFLMLITRDKPSALIASFAKVLWGWRIGRNVPL